MKDMVERCLETVGKEENIMGRVIFPYNEEEVLETFGIEDTKDLRFVDKRESKMSVAQFNHIIGEAEARGAKIEEQINASVRFLQRRMVENPEWKGTADEIPLNFEDGIVWNWCMKEDYRHPDEKVKVWNFKGVLNVFYGERDENKDYSKKGRGRRY